MSEFKIVITDCLREDFEQFLDRSGISGVRCEEEVQDVLCSVPSRSLERLFAALEHEAEASWENPDSTDLLCFDSAFFPASTRCIQPVRQLRGMLAARLQRKKEMLEPAYCVPGFLFGKAVAPVVR